MIEVAEALEKVLHQVRPGPVVHQPVLDAVGCALAQPVRALQDIPAAHKALMDGYAIRWSDWQQGRRLFAVTATVTAGMVPAGPVAEGQAVRVMTGAPVPEGADMVVPVEWTDLEETKTPPVVTIREGELQRGANILPRAQVMARGEVVMAAGHVIRPRDVGLLVECGAWQVAVHARPRVSVLATGNELVAPDQVPGPGQIRNSNGPMLVALARDAGAEVCDLGIARDEPLALERAVQEGLKSDVLVLSGGVSAGVLDLVPQVLGRTGVQLVFHKVNLKPGKPLWFGVQDNPPHRCLVFGLPGNPVSSLVCFYLFVRPALRRWAGWIQTAEPPRSAALEHDYYQRSSRPTYHPALLHQETGGECRVRLVPWQGSADQRAVSQADALAVLDPGPSHYPAGAIVPVIPL